jgi:hypothetical protein
MILKLYHIFKAKKTLPLKGKGPKIEDLRQKADKKTRSPMQRNSLSFMTLGSKSIKKPLS